MGSPRIGPGRLLSGVRGLAGARLAGALVLAGAGVAAGPAAAEYVFASPSVSNQNRVYWLDRYTGTVGACQYQGGGGPAGSMACYPPGEGARTMPSGDYDLKGSNWETEWGVFRLNRTTGEISLCFVKEAEVVCTPQAIAR